MSHCKTCKHWTPGEKYSLEAGWGFCEFADGEDGRATREGTLAYARDGDAYAAHLVTHETFGCVQHEARS